MWYDSRHSCTNDGAEQSGNPRTTRLIQAQVRNLQSLSERPAYDGVPKYGFSSWDSETARSLSLAKARRERGRRGR